MDEEQINFQITSEMLLDLMRGKDLHITSYNIQGERTLINLKGPFDGVFLTHEEIFDLKRSAHQSEHMLASKQQFLNIEKSAPQSVYVSRKQF